MDCVKTESMLSYKSWNDATLCYQNWQSCASCRPVAHIDGLYWDNLNFRIRTLTQAKHMLHSFDRGRVMEARIRAETMTAVKAGFKYIMLNAGITQKQYDAVRAYLMALEPEDIL